MAGVRVSLQASPQLPGVRRGWGKHPSIGRDSTRSSLDATYEAEIPGVTPIAMCVVPLSRNCDRSYGTLESLKCIAQIGKMHR